VEKGAKLAADRAEVFRTADIIVQFLCHGANDKNGNVDLPLFRKGQVLMAFCAVGDGENVAGNCRACVTSFAVELMPRITARKGMDVLSSMATICGYKAVLLAADTLPRMCPMLTTAAGTIAPARVLIIGAGVAGLQAIATARRLGAVASAYDMRPASKEQVQSLGGRFVELAVEAKDAQDASGYAKAQDESFYQKQRELLGNVIAESDVVIAAAVIPGKKIAGAGQFAISAAFPARSTLRSQGHALGPFLVTSTGDFFPGMTAAAITTSLSAMTFPSSSRLFLVEAFVLRLGVATGILRIFRFNRKFNEAAAEALHLFFGRRTHVISRSNRAEPAGGRDGLETCDARADDQHTRRSNGARGCRSASGTFAEAYPLRAELLCSRKIVAIEESTSMLCAR